MLASELVATTFPQTATLLLRAWELLHSPVQGGSSETGGPQIPSSCVWLEQPEFISKGKSSVWPWGKPIILVSSFPVPGDLHMPPTWGLPFRLPKVPHGTLYPGYRTERWTGLFPPWMNWLRGPRRFWCVLFGGTSAGSSTALRPSSPGGCTGTML